MTNSAVSENAAAIADNRLTDRALGCLLGLACGDALGGPVEFRSRVEIARDYPDGVHDFVGGGWLRLAPGEITDDTQMTLALGRALTAEGLDMPRLVAEFLAWYNSQPKDIGNTTRAALARLAAGVAWDQAGEASDVGSGRGVGNGSIMRCAPVALRFRRDRGKLVAASLDSARVTHAHPLCLWSAVAVNQAIAHLLNGGPVAQVTAAAVDGIAEPAVRDTVLNAAARPRDLVQSGGHVLATLGAAVWCLLRHDTLEETLVAAVALGDDTDTTGAVVGALAGAYFGMAAIPDRWLTRLQPRDELTALAHQLLAHSKSNASGQIFRAD